MNCFQCLAKQTIKITTFVNQGETKKPCHYWKQKQVTIFLGYRKQNLNP